MKVVMLSFARNFFLSIHALGRRSENKSARQRFLYGQRILILPSFEPTFLFRKNVAHTHGWKLF